jgi:glutamate dehydrogenase/leucine dehydrogenase
LILASKDEAITNENADELKCKVLIEEANGSVSYKAD